MVHFLTRIHCSTLVDLIRNLYSEIHQGQDEGRDVSESLDLAEKLVAIAEGVDCVSQVP